MASAISLPLNAESPWLAPLAGWSDLPFRLLCREHGAAVCCTEMVSAKGLVHNSPGTRELLRSTPEDAPLAVQLFGNEPDVMERAMEPLLDAGFVWFDLNMGCSVPKVTRTGCGAAMLKDLPGALNVARAMLRMAGERRVGFKLRLGWDEGSPVWEELALRLEDCGAGWIALHPRTARQGFGGKAHWPALARLAERLRIPVLASGDLMTAADGTRCLRQCGVSGVMYARGAMQNPAIFKDHHALLHGAPPAAPDARALLALIRRHAFLAREHSVERAALLKMRTFVPRYAHHLPGVRMLRQALAGCRDWAALDALLEDFLEAAHAATLSKGEKTL